MCITYVWVQATQWGTRSEAKFIIRVYMISCDAFCEPVMAKLLCLSCIVLLHPSVASSGGQLNVAPADFDSSCAQHASSYHPTEKIVLDTQYYTSQSLIDVHGGNKKWLSLDLDGTVGTSLSKVREQMRDNRSD